jgi:hypothetical protein
VNTSVKVIKKERIFKISSKPEIQKFTITRNHQQIDQRQNRQQESPQYI